MRKSLLFTTILILLSACSSGTSDRPTQLAQQTLLPANTIQPTATPSPTETPRPTATPVPTNTPTPTLTPEPTFTSMPSATPTPDYSEAISDYKSDLDRAQLQAGVYLGATVSFIEDASKEIALFLDEEWLQSVSDAAGLGSVAFTDLDLLDAPPPLADLHAELVDAANVCGRALSAMSSAGRSQDAVGVMQAFSDLADCGDDYKTARVAIDEAIDSWGTVSETSDTAADAEPTETPEPTPILPATEQPERAQTEVIASSAVEYENYEGTYRVFGLVGNTGSVDISFINVTVDLVDSQGTVLGSDSGYAHLYPLMPGQATTFEVVFPEKPAGAADYVISVDFLVSSLEPYDGIEIVSSAGSVYEWGGYEIAGEVENVGDGVANRTKLCVAFFDKDGDLIGVGWSFAELSEIPAGASSPFSVGVTHSYLDGESVDSYLLFAKASN